MVASCFLWGIYEDINFSVHRTTCSVVPILEFTDMKIEITYIEQVDEFVKMPGFKSLQWKPF